MEVKNFNIPYYKLNNALDLFKNVGRKISKKELKNLQYYEISIIKKADGVAPIVVNLNGERRVLLTEEDNLIMNHIIEILN